ncbi:recombination regulator RecX [Streptomyces sp. NPDC005921]|uniref:recombination regulator RecX n=1 Tax=unclassified Streptomyces TaxID=2593676 RepID=UPI0033E9ADA5
MTRRTDWADHEYTSPGAPRGRGAGGDPGSAGDGGEAHGTGGDGYGRDGEAYPGARRRRRGGAARGSESSYGRDGSYEDDGLPASYGGVYEDGTHDGPDGPRGHGSPGRGPRKSGTRRRRGFGEPSGEDGGSSSLSRAEQGEPPADPAERARAICLRLLTGTPRTRKQLADALRKREIPDEVAEEVLSRFEEVGLINDSAFADAWVESRHHGRGLARRALARELRTKGVEPSLIDEAVGQLDSEQEEETARELVARKLRSTQGLDRDRRIRRLAGMLARKGYAEGMALRIVRQALEEEGEDTEFLEGGDF